MLSNKKFYANLMRKVILVISNKPLACRTIEMKPFLSESIRRFCHSSSLHKNAEFRFLGVFVSEARLFLYNNLC